MGDSFDKGGGMTDAQGWSLEETPPPDPEKIASMLTRVGQGSRVNPEYQRKLAMNAETLAFLEAGKQLIEDELVNQSSRNTRGVLKFLSRESVVKQAKNPSLSINAGTFRDRWKSQSDYLADLVSYTLQAWHWSLPVALSPNSHRLVSGEVDFVDGVHEVAYRDLMSVLDSPIYRFQLLAIATAQGDPIVRESLKTMYSAISKAWQAVFTTALEVRGLKFRPGFTMADFDMALEAAAEGVGLRLLAEPASTAFIDHEKRRSLLGTMCLAIFVSVIDFGDGLSLDDYIRALEAQLREKASQSGPPSQEDQGGTT